MYLLVDVTFGYVNKHVGPLKRVASDQVVYTVVRSKANSKQSSISCFRVWTKKAVH